jgi:hypothetical protein
MRIWHEAEPPRVRIVVWPFFFGLRSRWSRWAIDRAGVESGNYSPRALRAMLDRGEITPHTWLRHVWTRRYALVGEVLFANGLASELEFEAWFPLPSGEGPRRSRRAAPKMLRG